MLNAEETREYRRLSDEVIAAVTARHRAEEELRLCREKLTAAEQRATREIAAIRAEAERSRYASSEEHRESLRLLCVENTKLRAALSEA